LRALRKYSAHEGREKNIGALGNVLDNGDPSRDEQRDTGARLRWKHSCASEEAIFYRLAKHIHNGRGPKSRREALDVIIAAIQWIDAAITMQQQANSLLSISVTVAHESTAQAIALAALIVAIVENDQVQQALRKGKDAAATGKELSALLESFIPLLSQSNPQSATRLALFRTQTLPSIVPAEKKVKANTASGEIDALIGEGLGVESIVVQELPVVNSRAGLYVYLNALVSVPQSYRNASADPVSLLEDRLSMMPHSMLTYIIVIR